MHVIIVLTFLSLAVSTSAESASLPSLNPLHQSIDRAGDLHSSAELDQRGTTSSPLVVETIENPSDATERLAAREHRTKESTNSRWTMIFTGLLLLVATLQAVLFFFQLRLMRASVNDASDVAVAAKESADVARQAFLADHRPWVHVENIAIRKAPMIDGGRFLLPLTIKLRNVGRSPAVGTWPIIHAMDVGVTDECPVGRQATIKSDGPNNDAGIAIFPNESAEIEVYAVMQANEFKAARIAEEIWPWIIGVIFYKSAPDQPWHRTGFIFNVFVTRSDPQDYRMKLSTATVSTEPIRLQLNPQGAFAD